MRFAGERPGSPEFSPVSLGAAGSAGNYSAAAGAVDIGNSFTSMREKAPRFDVLSSEAMKNQAAENIAAQEAEATVAGAGLTAFGQSKGLQMQAQATVEAAEVQAEAAKSKAMMGALGGVLSKGLGLIASDERTKDSITPIETALEKLRQLNPVSYYYKAEYGDPLRKHHGFVAQEMKSVIPDAVYKDHDTGMYCIDPGDLIGLLVRGNQELQARVSRLEAKAALQAV